MTNEPTTLSDPPRRGRRWLTVTVLAPSLALVVLLVLFLGKRDAQVRDAVDRLQPGMTRAEAMALLNPAGAVRTRDEKPGVPYIFYGVDEFVIVRMEPDGDEVRVKEIEHLPDRGPVWERLRRRVESRFR
jgi:hypothetical protein